MIRPIIFSAPMVRALLEGRKTQTRRVWKHQPVEWTPKGYEFCATGLDDDGFATGRVRWGAHDDEGVGFWLPYEPGDLLYVRESHYVWSSGHKDRSDLRINYRATEPDAPCTWKPSIHMPRWASRLTLAVTDVRVQRLQKISDRDAMEEGVATVPAAWDIGVANMDSTCNPERIAFRVLWNTLHGPGAWDKNPWVVALTFTAHKCNVDHFAAGGKEGAA